MSDEVSTETSGEISDSGSQSVEDGSTEPSTIAGGQRGQVDAGNDNTDIVPETAPEEYADFTLPEGVQVDNDLMDKFKDLAKEMNLTQENAQKFVDMQTATLKSSNDTQATKAKETVAKWRTELENDSEFGGSNFDANEKIVHHAVRTYGGDDIDVIERTLNQTGLGNFPPFVKMLWRIGQGIQEDNFESGGTPIKEVPTHVKLYGEDGKSGGSSGSRK